METAHNSQAARLWNGSFILVFIFSILCQINMGMSNIVLPLFVINGLGYSNAQSGLLGTMFTIASMACRFFAGNMTDRYGRRLIMIIGALFIGMALLALGFSSSFAIILIFKFMQGIGHSLNSTASNAAAADVLPKERLGEGIGYYGLNATLTGAVAPSLALVLMGIAISGGQTQNYRLPLLAAGGIGLLAAALAVMLGYKHGLAKAVPKSTGKFDIHHYIERRGLRPAILQAFQSMSLGAAVFMIVFANARGFKSIGIYYLLSAGCTLITRILIGKKIDRVKPVRVVMPPLILIIMSYVYLALTLSETAFIVNGVIGGIFNAISAPAFNSLCLKLSPANRSGAASATYWLCFDVGMAFGQIFFGLLIDVGGFFLCFISAAGFMAVFTVIAAVFLRPLKPIAEIVSPDG
ncbi:MAG: MFS transporter [Treponema sp.]|jgi:MFS family permease|nr:MFS transporter [Treponema sp.]